MDQDVYRDRVNSAFIGWKTAEKQYNDKLAEHAAPADAPSWVPPSVADLDRAAVDELERLCAAAEDQRGVYEQIKSQQ